jgi:hypothetical protein
MPRGRRGRHACRRLDARTPLSANAIQMTASKMPDVNRRPAQIAEVRPAAPRHLTPDLGAAAGAGGPGPTRTADLTLIRRAL